MEAYEKKPMIKTEIDAIIAAEHCHGQLAPVIAAFEAEKAKIYIFGKRKPTNSVSAKAK